MTDEVSIRAPRAGRDERHVPAVLSRPRVSIRAPRAGRDNYSWDHLAVLLDVSIRAPRAGRDTAMARLRYQSGLFLSARPGRGATTCHRRSASGSRRFYPRAPGGARLHCRQP